MTGLADEVVAVAHAWDAAMIENDPESIGPYMADDWIIIGPDGAVGDKASFLALEVSPFTSSSGPPACSSGGRAAGAVS